MQILFMMRRIGVLMMLSILVTSCGSEETAVSANREVGAVYVFGDSLSDTGNLGRPASFGTDLPEPFFQNRISNGPVVVDYIGQALGRQVQPANYLSLDEEGTNYALAGSQAESEPPDIDLGRQLDLFITRSEGTIDPDDLFVIFIGGNDVFEALGTTDPKVQIARSVDSVIEAVDRLARLGANRFALLNLPDIGSTPKASGDDGGADQSALASELSRFFNSELSDRIRRLQARQVNVFLVDVSALWSELYDNYQSLGFTDRDRPCFNTSEMEYFEYCERESLNRFVFFDSIHPSGAAHRYLGERVAARIQAALR